MSWLPTVFFLIALLYSMVGLGGGTSYLAVLVLAGLPYQEIPVIALICNIIVASSGFWLFYKAGFVRWRIVLPFVIFSVPMAYWGGRIAIDKDVFRLLLGFSLLIAALRMFLPIRSYEKKKEIPTAKAWAVGLPVGGLLGFLSGLLGMGGGIFLSPLLIFMRWVNVKEASAAAAFFIALNSLSGLAGHVGKGVPDFELIFPLAIAVFLGGQLGARFGAYKIPNLRLEKMLALFILYVSIKMIGAAL